MTKSPSNKAKKQKTKEESLKPHSNLPKKILYKVTPNMPRLNDYNTILHPVCNEGAMKKVEEFNTLTFIVDLKANKPKIKRVIEKLYSVKLAKVNTLRTPKMQKKVFAKLTSDYDAVEIAQKIGVV